MSEEIIPYKTPYFLYCVIVSSIYSILYMGIQDDYDIIFFCIHSVSQFVFAGLIALPISFFMKSTSFYKILFYLILVIGVLMCYGAYLSNFKYD